MENKLPSELCPTHLVEDVPADRDGFGAGDTTGPHQRVANALFDLIASKERGGKMIALEGGWGSGKSTVVNLLRHRMENLQNFEVIAFDAWAHEGDPLRRTFLETLIRGLKDAKWIGNSWDTILKHLSNRQRNTESISIPNATILGTVLAISAFCVPLGVNLMSAVSRDGISFGWNLKPNFLYIFAALVAASPLIVLITNLIRILLHSFRGNKIEWREEWAVLLSSAKTQTTTTFESVEPTSIEFEDYFAQLMKEILPADSSRRLLLVLDNLDRVEPQSALAIWSTLQTFLQDLHHRKESWFHKLWVLVPYDSAGLRKLWDKPMIASSLATEGNSHREGNDDGESLISDSFLDKSFQIRFYVPPPVLSDWKSYLDALASMALPCLSDQERHALYRVFDHCRRGAVPTPRQLKNFVNQIGAVHRQWQHQFPVDHVAYFVLKSRERKSIVEDLRKGNISESAIRILSPNATESLAGLAFNVLPNKGMELLLIEPIHEALSSGDHIALEDLSSRYGSGYVAVMETVAEERFHSLDPISLANSARALEASTFFNGRDETEKSAIVRHLFDATQKTVLLLPFTVEMSQGMAVMCRLNGTEAFVTNILGKLQDTVKSMPQPLDNGTRESVIKSVIGFLQTVSTTWKALSIPVIELPFGAGEWRLSCRLIESCDSNSTVRHLIKPTCKMSSAVNHISGHIELNEFTLDEMAAIRVTFPQSQSEGWSEVVQSLESRLLTEHDPDSDEDEGILNALIEMRRMGVSGAAEKLDSLVNEGWIMHFYHAANVDQSPSCRAMCALLQMQISPAAPPPPVVRDSATGYQDFVREFVNGNDATIIPAMVQILRREDGLIASLDMVDSRDDVPAVLRRCFEEIATDEGSVEFFTPSVLVKRWDTVSVIIDTVESDAKGNELAAKIAASSNLYTLIRGAGLSAGTSSLCLAILNADVEPLESFLEWCDSQMRLIATEIWLDDFKNGSTLVLLALRLGELNSPPVLSTLFMDAIVSHAKEMALDQAQLREKIKSKWKDLLTFISEENMREETRSRLLSVAIETGGGTSQLFWEVYGEELQDVKTIRENERSLQLLSGIVQQRNESGLEWQSELFKKFPDCLEGFPDDALTEFQLRLRDFMASPKQDKAQLWIEDIGSKLGIKALSKAEETESGDSEGK